MALLLIFVPGFLGSSTSFASFPTDVAASLKGIGGTSRLTTLKMFPSFDCKNSAEAAVASLVDFLNAESVGFKQVICLCHSMGGLLAIDALRKGTQANVIAVISFDSPFYGLHARHTVSDVPSSLSSTLKAQLPSQESRAAAYESISSASKSAYSTALSTYTSTTASSYALISRLHTSALQASASLISSIPSAATSLPGSSAAAAAAAAAALALSNATSKSITDNQTFQQSQRIAAGAYEFANRGAQSVYSNGAALYDSTAKAVEKVPTGAAVVVGGTVLAAATGAAMSAMEVVAVGSVAAVGVVGSAAVLGVAGVASGVVAVNKVRNVIKKRDCALVVVGGGVGSDSDDAELEPMRDGDGDEAIQVTEAGVGNTEELHIKASVVTVLEEEGFQTTPLDNSLEARLGRITDRKNQLERESMDRQNAIEARLKELEANGGGDCMESTEVEFANILFVDESVDIGITEDDPKLPSAELDTQQVTAIQESNVNQESTSIVSSIIKRPLLTTAAVTIGGSALAVGAYGAYYYSGGLISLAAPTARSLAVGWAMKHASEASKHLKFLYPLWGESRVNCEQRMQFVKDQSINGNLLFRCFYLEVPPLLPISKEEAVTPAKRTFIKLPPESSADLFTAIEMDIQDVQDVISAHTSMLKKTQNIAMYWHLVDESARIIELHLLRLERNGRVLE